jgi:hypothetical protein
MTASPPIVERPEIHRRVRSRNRAALTARKSEPPDISGEHYGVAKFNCGHLPSRRSLKRGAWQPLIAAETPPWPPALKSRENALVGSFGYAESFQSIWPRRSIIWHSRKLPTGLSVRQSRRLPEARVLGQYEVGRHLSL